MTRGNWISVEDNPPDDMQLCVVKNEKGWMTDASGVRALYKEDPGVFVLYEPPRNDSLLLDVTHYIPIT